MFENCFSSILLVILFVTVVGQQWITSPSNSKLIIETGVRIRLVEYIDGLQQKFIVTFFELMAWS